MTKQDAINKFNTDHELFLGSDEGWKAQHGDNWQQARNDYIILAKELHEKRNAKFGTTGKLLIKEEIG